MMFPNLYLLTKNITKFSLIMSFVVPSVAFSSVTMIGSRIVYVSDHSSVDVEFTNSDIIPYAVQTWFDNGDETSTPATGKSPFYASPSLFKVQPSGGQQLRISYVGKDTLPQDRESLFYFNFLQIPPINSDGNDTKSNNKMLILLKNRVKIFYRPAGIVAKIPQIHDKIKVSSSADILIIKNDSPFYVSISSVKIKQGGSTYTQPADMLIPFSERRVKFKKAGSINNAVVVINSINDQGAKVSHEYEVNP